VNRRSVLATVGSALSLGVAGCLGNDDPDPRVEAVVAFFEFEEEADELTFERRNERTEQLFHSESPTSEYQEYRREEYRPPFAEHGDIETDLVETDLGEDQLRESRYFEENETGGLASRFAGKNGLVDVTLDIEERPNPGTSTTPAFVVTEDGEWCIFSWGLPGYR
jgi:hypothetical protein